MMNVWQVTTDFTAYNPAQLSERKFSKGDFFGGDVMDWSVEGSKYVTSSDGYLCPLVNLVSISHLKPYQVKIESYLVRNDAEGYANKHMPSGSVFYGYPYFEENKILISYRTIDGFEISPYFVREVEVTWLNDGSITIRPVENMENTTKEYILAPVDTTPEIIPEYTPATPKSVEVINEITLEITPQTTNPEPKPEPVKIEPMAQKQQTIIPDPDKPTFNASGSSSKPSSFNSSAPDATDIISQALGQMKQYKVIKAFDALNPLTLSNQTFTIGQTIGGFEIPGGYIVSSIGMYLDKNCLEEIVPTNGIPPTTPTASSPTTTTGTNYKNWILPAIGLAVIAFVLFKILK